MTSRLVVSGNDSLDDYPLAVFCSAYTNNDKERMSQIIRVSRQGGDVAKSRRDHPEDPAHRERRLLREQLRRQHEKEKKEKRRMRERLRREQKKREKNQLKQKDENNGMEGTPSVEELKKEEVMDQRDQMEEEVNEKKESEMEEVELHNTALPVNSEPLTVKQEESSVEMVKNETPVLPPTPVESVVVPTAIPSAPMNESVDADCVVMASSLNHLHLWVLPHLEQIKDSYLSISFDLTPFVPSVEIQDVAFLDGFDHKGTTVAVASKNGLVLILDCVEQQLLYKVRTGREIEG